MSNDSIVSTEQFVVGKKDILVFGVTKGRVCKVESEYFYNGENWYHLVDTETGQNFGSPSIFWENREDIRFRWFRVNSEMGLWEHIRGIFELQKQGVLTEECPSPTYWEYRVIDFDRMPKDLVNLIIDSGRYVK